MSLFPKAGQPGTREANRKIFDILYGLFQEDPDMGLQHFTVIEPDNPMAKECRKVSDRIVKRQGVRHSGPCGRDAYLEDVYIYRISQPALNC